MSFTEDTLRRLEGHWAIEAVGLDRCREAIGAAHARLVQSAVGRIMRLDVDESLDLLQRVATAYEVAASEGVDALLHPATDELSINLADQAQAGAFRAYELLQVLPIPSDPVEKVFHVLHAGALAYCGDRWSDLRRWLKENSEIVTSPSVATAGWELRVLFRLYECWVRLFRKNQWDDLDGVREIIAGLREDQRQHEGALLGGEDGTPTTALRLIALYHWARATELLAVYMLQGEPTAIGTELDQHFEGAGKASRASQDPILEVLLRWLHVAARRMVAGSVWWVAKAVNSRVTKFVNHATRTRSLFELLPPQRAALQEQGLLDQASRAIVVNLPTSGGKTVLAQFRMLQALNQFDADNGWVAYVAPTRALVSQITRRLRADFEPLKIHVEQLTSAVELDGFEQSLLAEPKGEHSFHVLVATPEKLSMVIRNRAVPRPLALIVVDEAHNLEDEERGLRVELLLATIKRDAPRAHFLLLMPYVPNARDLANWLEPGRGRTISLGSTPWQPNERIVGLFDIKKSTACRGAWTLHFESLVTTPKTIHLKGGHQVDGVKPLALSYSDAKSLTRLTGAMAKVFSERGTSIAVARTIPDSWAMARCLKENMPVLEKPGPEIELVRKFLQTEISADFELCEMLCHGVAVHHAGLSEETRSLVEWLAECGKLKVLCATTTIAQGINFPVASVFLATRQLPYGKEMSKRAFWNLAGRAGRVGQDSVGVVGLAAGNDRQAIVKYVSDATEDLVSRLVTMLRDISQADLPSLTKIIHGEQWSDFRSYIAHLVAERNSLEEVLAETEQVLRNTYGYSTLHANKRPGDRDKAVALLDATKNYARELAAHPENAALADATGFDPEGVRTALLEMGKLERKLTASDWQPSSLFGAAGSALPQLVGVMMQVPQIRGSLEDLGGKGIDKRHVSELARDWVNGSTIRQIAEKYFSGGKDSESVTEAITQACKGVYRALANSGTWGLAALSRLRTSGIDFEKLTPEQRRAVNNLPAMLYHGVNTEAAVLMRTNSVPRSIAPDLGEQFAAALGGSVESANARQAREYLRALDSSDWQRAAPAASVLSGAEYREVWLRLSGELG